METLQKLLFISRGHFQFLSYLWGMETPNTVQKYANRYLFLSYLWGMETIIQIILKIWRPESSYPTYEEWKQYAQRKTAKGRISSYPTYEEWKPSSLNQRGFPSIGSYPTYEEWKLVSLLFIFFDSLFEFLSYLWGMETGINNHFLLPPFYFVLILPMRNGNNAFSFSL